MRYVTVYACAANFMICPPGFVVPAFWKFMGDYPLLMLQTSEGRA